MPLDLHGWDCRQGQTAALVVVPGPGGTVTFVRQARGPYAGFWLLPGGKVGFYKGLLDFCDTDDMAACVLGHEVGHVTARHAALRAGQQTATNLALQAGGAVVGSTVKMSSEQLNMAMAVAVQNVGIR